MNKPTQTRDLEIVGTGFQKGVSATIIVRDILLEDQKTYKLRHTIRWVDMFGVEKLQLQFGLTIYPVVTRASDPAMIGQIRRRELLCLKFVNPSAFPISFPTIIPPHFVVQNNLYPITVYSGD